ncbi:MAG: hypothetical protein Fur0018_06410 [Anaerolineales bacterium]
MNFETLYAGFGAPIAAFDCGAKCAPYNEGGIPFCCDTRHAVPTVYLAEWDYLRKHTDLWHPWQAETPQETAELQAETPDGQMLVACLGHRACQRGFRSLTCRAFPFFPYLNSQAEFLGLSYYWAYADRCWVANNLQVVSEVYVRQFVAAYERVFAYFPQERENFMVHCAYTRETFIRRRRRIPLLHRNGLTYQISPRTERLHPVRPEALPKYGPYKIAAWLSFPDEV